MEAESIQGAVTNLENEVLALRRKCGEVQMSIDDLINHRIDQGDQHNPRARSDEPSIITHSHFDSSISHWFPAVPEIHHEPIRTFPRGNEQALGSNQLSILYEFLSRLCGVSAFPLQSKGDKKVLGIRFDQYNPSRCLLDKPFYLILQEESDNDSRGCDSTIGSHRDNSADTDTSRWSVYSHTLPSRILNGEIAAILTSPFTEIAMRQLVCSIRDALLLTT